MDTLNFVAAGARYMDETTPDWALSVDPLDLDMSDGEYCIIGQVDGEYWDGLKARQLSNDDAQRYGFNLMNDAELEDDAYNPSHEEWETLGYQWRAEINKRLKGYNA